MDIIGYRDSNDGRYYVPVIVQPRQPLFAFRINFLLDTGAARTQLSWNDATEYGEIAIRALPPENSIYRSMGGSANGFRLDGTTLTFRTSEGYSYDIQIDYLSLSDFKTTDDRECPMVASVLGIDMLSRFDLLFRGVYVIMTTTIPGNNAPN